VKEPAFLKSGGGTPEADEGHDFGSNRAATLYRRYTESKKDAEGVKQRKPSRDIGDVRVNSNRSTTTALPATAGGYALR
jgi:hypothetical protein